MIIKALFILLGTISLGLGILGIVIPGLPTTPFLLLTATLYLKASPRLHQKLVNHKFLGAPLRNYEKNKGITKRGFFISLSMMWSMILISIIFLISAAWLKGVLILAGVAGTITLLKFPKAQAGVGEKKPGKYPGTPGYVMNKLGPNQNL